MSELHVAAKEPALIGAAPENVHQLRQTAFGSKANSLDWGRL